MWLLSCGPVDDSIRGFSTSCLRPTTEKYQLEYSWGMEFDEAVIQRQSYTGGAIRINHSNGYMKTLENPSGTISLAPLIVPSPRTERL
jgi:hypothetical protein